MTFATLNEKSGPSDGAPTPSSGRRSLRTLPFSRSTFRQITKSFYTHGDIARVVSRADIPTFSSSEVRMGDYPAHGRS